MTKTLTEQWKNGELPDGLYYVKDWDDTIYRFVAKNKILWRDSNNPIYASERIEVLAPVPSYEEWKTAKENLEKNGTWYTERAYNELVSKTEQLEKRLEIATKALKEIPDLAGTNDNGINDYGIVCCAEDALKEIEGVK